MPNRRVRITGQALRVRQNGPNVRVSLLDAQGNVLYFTDAQLTAKTNREVTLAFPKGAVSLTMEMGLTPKQAEGIGLPYCWEIVW